MRRAIPLNAILVSLLVNCLLPLVNIGSSAALNALFSLSGVSILTSYLICIGCLVLKRIRRSDDALPARRWTLGRSGLYINIAALCFLAVLSVFCFFPPATPIVTPGAMNWGCLLYGSVVIFATGYYLVRGRDEYSPPVYRVRRDL
jgi:amino acid transporter